MANCRYPKAMDPICRYRTLLLAYSGWLHWPHNFYFFSFFLVSPVGLLSALVGSVGIINN